MIWRRWAVFLYLESQVYENNPKSIAEIIRVISEIEPKLCLNVIEGFKDRLDVVEVQGEAIWQRLFFVHKFHNWILQYQ